MGKEFIESTSRLMRRVPVKAWLAVGGLLVGAFWMQQHDGRIRQQARLQQLRSETSAQVAGLRKQAEQDVRQANVEKVKRQFVCKRRTIERAGESSIEIPWFGTRTLNTGTSRFPHP